MLLVQGAGASWYPLVYENYDDATKYARALRKREQKLLYVRAMADHLRPKTVVVAAGPPAFLDASLRYANADPSFPTPGEARVWLKQARYTGRVEAPLPGDCFDLASGELTKDAGMHASFSWEQTSAYIAKYAQRMQANIAAVYRRADEIVVPSMHEAVCAHFERMTNLSTYFNERIDMTLCLDVEGAQGGQWLVDFGLKPRVRRRADGETYQYRYRQEYLLPEKALAHATRKAINEALARDHPEIFVQIEPAVWQKPWVAHAQAAGRGPTALRYLAAYVKAAGL